MWNEKRSLCLSNRPRQAYLHQNNCNEIKMTEIVKHLITNNIHAGALASCPAIKNDQPKILVNYGHNKQIFE